MLSNKFLAGLARYAGLLALLAYFLACLVIVVMNYRGAGYTISRHIGFSAASIVIFAVVGTIAAGLLAVNLFFHSRCRWDFGKMFVIYAIVTVVCLAVVGWFPHVDDGCVVVNAIHRVAAWLMILLTPVFAVGFLRKGGGGKLFRVYLGLFVVLAVGFVLAAVFVSEFFFSISLYTESLYLLSLVGLTQILAFAPKHI